MKEWKKQIFKRVLKLRRSLDHWKIQNFTWEENDGNFICSFLLEKEDKIMRFFYMEANEYELEIMSILYKKKNLLFELNRNYNMFKCFHHEMRCL
ncbi:MAG: hypothetical protein ACTSQY_00560 [Candidatus Odinarchaeia archaeon]|nr:MAG: hypothetical protein [Lokiarchaeota virus Fenrir Meg22_1012]URC17293.1 MAG: hypothetical protein [Lokiarchaeota virus Fenrir Meg22_1214]